jgi:hypothetical protein
MMLALTAFATTVAADDIVSVSGECYNGDYSEGGGGHLAITSDATMDEQGVLTDDNGEINPVHGGGAVDGVLHFGIRSAQSSPGEACQGPDEGESTPNHGPRSNGDYLAVSVLDVMVCYDGNPNVWANPGAWGCTTRPGGIPPEN